MFFAYASDYEEEVITTPVAAAEAAPEAGNPFVEDWTWNDDTKAELHRQVEHDM